MKYTTFPLSGTMQFSGRRRKLNTNSQVELYGQNLQFYGQPPLENISLSEFETFAVERLKCETLFSFILDSLWSLKV